MHTKELKRILNKVDEMRRQRNELHTKLRDSIAQDDLTRLLVTATSDSGPLDRLFADQLSKHQTLVSTYVCIEPGLHLFRYKVIYGKKLIVTGNVDRAKFSCTG